MQILEVREQRRKGAPSIIPKEPTIWEGLKQGVCDELGGY